MTTMKEIEKRMNNCGLEIKRIAFRDSDETVWVWSTKQLVATPECDFHADKCDVIEYCEENGIDLELE